MARVRQIQSFLLMMIMLVMIMHNALPHHHHDDSAAHHTHHHHTATSHDHHHSSDHHHSHGHTDEPTGTDSPAQAKSLLGQMAESHSNEAGHHHIEVLVTSIKSAKNDNGSAEDIRLFHSAYAIAYEPEDKLPSPPEPSAWQDPLLTLHTLRGPPALS